MNEQRGNSRASSSSSISSASLNSSSLGTQDDHTIAKILAEEEENALKHTSKLGKRLSHLDSIPSDCLDDLAYSIMYEISLLCYRGSDEDVNRTRNQVCVRNQMELLLKILDVLLCCWLAAVGAGHIKSEEIPEGAARLRLSNDIEFEEQTLMAMMNESREKRSKLRVPKPIIPMEIRVEKALDAIYVCCFGSYHIEEEDRRLLAD